MLELIHNQKNKLNNTQESGAADESQSHQFINDIINQIKFVHVEKNWNAQISSLTQVVHEANIQKHLKAL